MDSEVMLMKLNDVEKCFRVNMSFFLLMCC